MGVSSDAGGPPPSVGDIPVIPERAERPGAWAELPPEPPRRHVWRERVRGWRGLGAIAAVVAWAVLGWLVLYEVGVGGWQFGWLLSMVAMAAGAGALVWVALGAGYTGRGTWVAAVVVLGLVAGIKLADAAPLSTGRLAQRIDAMHIEYQLWQRVSERRLGHGWCSPQCPEVISVYRSPNDSDAGALAVALAGLHNIGLVGDVRDAYVHQRGPDIVVGRSSHFRGVVSIGHMDDRVELTIDFTSGR